MALDIGDGNWAWVLGHAGVWALVLARVLGLCLTAPALAIPELDWRFRLMLAAALSAVLIPVLEASIAPPSDWSSAGWAVAAGGPHRRHPRLVGRAHHCRSAPGGRADRRSGRALDGVALRPRDGRGDDRAGPALRLDRAGGVSGARWPPDPGSCVGGELPGRTRRPALDLTGDRGAGVRAGRPRPRAVAPSRRAPALALTLAGVVLGWLSRAAPSLPFVALALPIRCVLGVVLVILSLTTLVATLAGTWDTLPF